MFSPIPYGLTVYAIKNHGVNCWLNVAIQGIQQIFSEVFDKIFAIKMEKTELQRHPIATTLTRILNGHCNMKRHDVSQHIELDPKLLLRKINADKKNKFNMTEHGDAWDCLLYTSPSPRDISGSRMPSSA